MNNTITTFDLSCLEVAVKEADQITLAPNAREGLLKFIELERKVAVVKDLIKDTLAQRGLELNPNFKSIHDDKIVVLYKSNGPPYSIDETMLEMLPEELYKKEVKYKPQTKEITAFIKKSNGKVPAGIKVNDRKKSIMFYPKGEKVSDDE